MAALALEHLAIVNNPTFSGLLTANGGVAATTGTFSGAVTLSSLGAGIVQTNASGVVKQCNNRPQLSSVNRPNQPGQRWHRAVPPAVRGPTLVLLPLVLTQT